jgi:predicted RNA-binding Zn-ribbon protein involved in translation (DUF1610 family)
VRLKTLNCHSEEPRRPARLRRVAAEKASGDEESLALIGCVVGGGRDSSLTSFAQNDTLDKVRNMRNLITLTCPSCGGRLEVTNNTEQYVCVHCGNAHIVDPGVRAESLEKEVEQIRLKVDIRHAEEDLKILRERQATLETQISAQRDGRRVMLMLIWPLPIIVVVLGLQQGASLAWTLLLALFSVGFLIFATWIIMSSDSYKKEKRELARTRKHIASGQQTLNFLQQELKHVSNSQQPTVSN